MSEKTDSAALRRAQMRELASLHDIPLKISIEIGRLKLRVRDLMLLKPNSVLELKKPAGEPLDICINGHHLARGEVVIVEQTAGVRIIEVFKPGASMSGALDQ